MKCGSCPIESTLRTFAVLLRSASLWIFVTSHNLDCFVIDTTNNQVVLEGLEGDLLEGLNTSSFVLEMFN